MRYAIAAKTGAFCHFWKLFQKTDCGFIKKYDLDTSGQSGSDSDGTSSTTDKEGEDDEDDEV